MCGSVESTSKCKNIIILHLLVVHSKSKCNKQPRFSWSLIYEKHRRFAPRMGRVAPKSDTSNTKKEPPFVGSPRLIIFVLLCINN